MIRTRSNSVLAPPPTVLLLHPLRQQRLHPTLRLHLCPTTLPPMIQTPVLLLPLRCSPLCGIFLRADIPPMFHCPFTAQIGDLFSLHICWIVTWMMSLWLSMLAASCFGFDSLPVYCFPFTWPCVYSFCSRFYVFFKIPWWQFQWSFGRLSCRLSRSHVFGSFFWLWYLFCGVFDSTLIVGCHALRLGRHSSPLLDHLDKLDSDSLLPTRFPPSGFDSRLGLGAHVVNLTSLSRLILHHRLTVFGSAADPLRTPFLPTRLWGENFGRRRRRRFQPSTDLYLSYLKGLDDDSISNLVLMAFLTPVDDCCFWDPVLWDKFSDGLGFEL